MLRICAGATAGTVDAVLLSPLERTQTFMQLRPKAGHSAEFDSATQGAQARYDSCGLSPGTIAAALALAR